MNKQKKLLEKIILKSNTINIILGMVLVVSLAIIYQNPHNHSAILAGCSAGGLMNLLSGLKMMRETSKRQLGMTYLMLGAILIAVGFVIIQNV